MDKANDIITNIIKEVLTALYQPFGAAVLMAFVSMFVFLYAREHGWKKGSLIKNIFGTRLWLIFVIDSYDLSPTLKVKSLAYARLL